MADKIPVILVTDIGTDIDDTWALGMMLKQSHLKPLLIVTDTGDVRYRAAICTHFLECAGRTEVEVATGGVNPEDKHNYAQRQAPWVNGINPEDYKGRFSADGVQRLIDVIMASEEPVTVIDIGPCYSLAEALRRCPEIAVKCNFVGMFGSIIKGHQNSFGAFAEYNVVCDIPACQTVFKAPWRTARITPLDTCSRVVLEGELFQKVYTCKDGAARNIIDNYSIWNESYWNGAKVQKSEELKKSSILFDTVAIHLASSTQFLKMVELPLSVTDDGYTVIDSVNGTKINVALDWEDLPAYEEFLTNIYCN